MSAARKARIGNQSNVISEVIVNCSELNCYELIDSFQQSHSVVTCGYWANKLNWATRCSSTDEDSVCANLVQFRRIRTGWQLKISRSIYKKMNRWNVEFFITDRLAALSYTVALSNLESNLNVGIILFMWVSYDRGAFVLLITLLEFSMIFIVNKR